MACCDAEIVSLIVSFCCLLLNAHCNAFERHSFMIPVTKTISFIVTAAALVAVWTCTLSADPPDIRSVEPDLQIPAISTQVAAGKRFKEFLPDYSETDVYHVVYLPTDWRPGAKFPVIVEYAGNGGYKNRFGDVSLGRPEDSKLGFGISAGRGFIWVCLPYLNNAATTNVIKWWGDPPQYDPQPTVDYCKQAVPWICAKYGGDPDRVVLAGFSRGAIACNFIGLHDDEIAKLWRGFVAYSHYDGVVERWGYPGCDRASAIERLKRLGARLQFICAEEGAGNHSIVATKAVLDSTGVDGNFTFRGTGFRNHNDAWILRPSRARSALRAWLQTVVE